MYMLCILGGKIEYRIECDCMRAGENEIEVEGGEALVEMVQSMSMCVCGVQCITQEIAQENNRMKMRPQTEIG